MPPTVTNPDPEAVIDTGDPGAPSILSLSANPPVLFDVKGPQTVWLSWQTSGATWVTLSDNGMVFNDGAHTDVAMTVEATTTFVLTAFDATLSPAVSQTVTVAVEQVRTGMIVTWSGSPTDIPFTGWLLCDGTTYDIADYPALGALLGSAYGGDGASTFAVPDLSNAFIQGASMASSDPPQSKGGPDSLSHTHIVGPFPNGTPASPLSTQPSGSHTHGMPAEWYGISLSTSDGSHAPGINAPQFGSDTTISSSGIHDHSFDVSFAAFSSEFPPSPSSVTGIGARPAWISLCHLIKT